MKMKKTVVSGLTLGLLVVGGLAAQAGTTFKGYDTTVGAFNGSGYTSYQTKSGSGTWGDLESTSVGGSYKVDARMQASSGTGDWARDITDGSKRDLKNSVASGKDARVQFSNDLSTSVSVQVSGKWRSN